MKLRQQPEFTKLFHLAASSRLPVFMFQGNEYAIFYAPKFVCVVPQDTAAETALKIDNFSSTYIASDTVVSPSGDGITVEVALRVLSAAHRAEETFRKMSGTGFLPECLTLFLNDSCNLKCRYCHTFSGIGPNRPISNDATKTLARFVATSSARRQRPLTVAFHGGGEPSLNEVRVNQILDIVREEAKRCGVELRTYIATNGVMSGKRARWVASRFDLVGLSCDGPPDVQDYQRPARDGLPTSPRVRQTGAILHQFGTPYHIRATITKETLKRQPEIAAYFIENYAPVEIRLEPIYVNPILPTGLSIDDAPNFVDGFIAARKVASAKGIYLTTSLTLPSSLYGRYCNVLRHVLNLVPGDIATGCFLESCEEGIERRQVKVGTMNSESACFEPDMDRIESLITRCSMIPTNCRVCLCCFQCTYGCPDICAMETPEPQKDVTISFRCHANQLLMSKLILEMAETAWHRTPPGVHQDVLVPESMMRVAVYRTGSTGGASP